MYGYDLLEKAITLHSCSTAVINSKKSGGDVKFGKILRWLLINIFVELAPGQIEATMNS